MKPIITINNLGKSYMIRHEGAKRSNTLRDEIGGWAKNLTRRRTKEERPSKEEFWALKDVSFEINPGDRVGIIGRNGAGKSTLLKILSRITEPTKGEIKIRGRVASLLEVGTGFHPELSGRENIYLNGAILGMSRQEIKKKFDEIVAFAEVEKFLDTPVKRYSSGMYVRLAFAVAAHLEPEILIVDEVLAVGDSQFQKKCLGKMEDVGKEGRTVLFVSHNMGAVKSLCKNALILNEGKLIEYGTTDKIITRYNSSNSSVSYFREWSDFKIAPQNGAAILVSVRICDEFSNTLESITTDINFFVEIQYNVIIDSSYIGMTVVFYDSDNKCVFGSINNHETNFYGKEMQKRRYKSLCKIPANLFNNGLFSISIIIFGKSFSGLLTVPEVLKFEILDGITVRKDYFGNFEGTIRPLLKWETIIIKEEL